MIHCEWGEMGLLSLSPQSRIAIIVDVLSFSTSVDAATAAGAEVFPFSWKDEKAKTFAKNKGALLALQRQDAKGRPSLSPPSLQQLKHGDRLVLPSPNGSTLSAASKSPYTFAACLRNHAAVCEAVQKIGSAVTVIAAGERWSDGSLRPALEDWLGAGAVIGGLSGEKSPEAMAAEESFSVCRNDLQARMLSSVSGRQLIEMGFSADVVFAAQDNVSKTAPVLDGERYRDFKP